MNLDEATIYKIADLARIEVNPEQVQTLMPEMNKILSFMEKLNELDTEAVAPLVYMNESANSWREDVVKPQITTAEALQNAAIHNEEYFMVPKIIEK